MYTRCHSITSLFQKTILLKDSKYNAYVHRKLHSESILTKIETKLKPLKRCFSGGPNKYSNFNMGTRSVEGVGFTRNSLPAKSFVIPRFPRELVQQMPPRQVQHNFSNFTNQDLIGNRDTLVRFPVSLNNSTRNDKGKITIVIDKADVCNCTSPNEDVTIHVTTTPKLTPKRIIEGLSEADLNKICNAKCSCCQQCDEFKKSSNPRMFPVDPNLTLLQPFKNYENKLNRLPRQQQSFPSIPLRSLPPINDGFTNSKNDSLRAKRSRSMDDFHATRKMISPNSFEPKTRQLPMKSFGKRQQHPQVYKGRSESRQFPLVNSNRKQVAIPLISEPNQGQRRRNSSFQMPFSGNKVLPQRLVSQQQPLHKRRSESRQFPFVNLNNNQKQLVMPRTSEPNVGQRRRNSSFQMPLSGNKVLPQRLVSQQQPLVMRRENFVQKEKQFTRPRQQNNVPLPTRSNLNVQQSIPTGNGGGGIKINESLPFQGQQSQPLVNRVLKPPTLDAPNRFWSKREVVSAPNITTAPVKIQVPRLIKLFPKKSNPPPNIFYVSKQPKLTSLQQPKNRFPEKWRSNASGGVNQFNPVKLGPLNAPRPVANSIRSRKSNPQLNIFQVGRQPKFTSQLQTQLNNRFPEKWRSYASGGISPSSQVKLRALISPRPVPNSIRSNNYLAPTMRSKQKSPTLLSRETSLTGTNQLNIVRQKEVDQKPFLLRRQLTQVMPKKTNLVGLASNTQIRNRQQQNEKRNPIPQQPLFAPKNKSPQMNKVAMNVCNTQPPRLVLKKRIVPRPAFNSFPPIKNRHQQNFRLQRNFAPHQSSVFASRQRSATLPMYRKSLIPVPQHKSLSQRNLSAKTNFPPKRNLQLLSKNPNIVLPTRNRNSLIPVRKNYSNISLRQNIATQPQPHTTARRKHPVVPFGTHLTQRTKVSRNKLAGHTQRKRSILDPMQRRNDIRKMNQVKLQSSLPMSIMNPNQDGKYIGISMSPQSTPISKTNVQLQNMPQIRPMLHVLAPPMKNFLTPQIHPMPQVRPMPHMLAPPMKNFLTPQPLQKNCQIPQPPMKYYQKSALCTKQPSTRRDKFKGIPSKYSMIDNVNIASNGNPAVLFHAPGKLKLIGTPVPRLTDENGVIVKMLYVHLTDADAQMLASEQNGPYKLTSPTIAGRSGSGVIVDVGKQVQNIKVGDTVSIKPISCGKCSACKNNTIAMCKRVPTSEKFGILKRFHALPAKFVTKLPEKVNPIDGAMIDELSCAIRACKKSAVTAGDNILVLDGGSLGLWTALAAKSMGATNVCLADPRNSMLEQAKKLGIDRLFLIHPNTPISDTAISISDYMEGDNPRVVFDCNGSSLTNQIAINTAKIGGKVVLMKNVESNKPIVLSDAINREIDILVSHHGNNNSERAALQFLASGKVQLNGINSCLFDISNVDEAFRSLNSGSTSNIFIQLNRPEDENNAKKDSKTS